MSLTNERKHIGPLLIAACFVLFFMKVYETSLRSYNSNSIFENPKIAQDDPRILKYLLNGHLTPPSNAKRYNLTCGGDPFCFGGATITDDSYGWRKGYHEAIGLLRNSIDELLGKKRNDGFFIESGANDGEFLSNTFYLEQERNWTGLLIEADPLPFRELKTKNRIAYISNTCLSTEPTPALLKFERGEFQGTSQLNDVSGGSKKFDFEAECFPLYSYLAALNIKEVDYLSLDIEGAELKVLRNFPFDKVLVKVITVEANQMTFDGMKKFLESKNFILYKSIKGPFLNDNVFVNYAFLQKD